MPIAESLLPDFDHEMATTRALLELVPAERAAWKPHVKSMSLGDLAMHVARIPGWAQTVMTGTEFDTSPPDIPREAPPAFQSVGHLLKGFDEVVASARAKLAAATDGELMVQWTLKNAGRTVFHTPRVAVLRSFILNHIIHHRGQLSVYLRLCDVPLPAIYGPTADMREPPL